VHIGRAFGAVTRFDDFAGEAGGVGEHVDERATRKCVTTTHVMTGSCSTSLVVWSTTFATSVAATKSRLELRDPSEMIAPVFLGEDQLINGAPSEGVRGRAKTIGLNTRSTVARCRRHWWRR